jgi:nucleotidyltransferase DUF2204
MRRRSVRTAVRDPFDPRASSFYRQVIGALELERIPFLVGGAFALQRYAGIFRFTKDLDLFVRPAHVDAALDALCEVGHTELTAPYWLAKCTKDDILVDLIFSSGNGVATVDDEWFARGEDDELLGLSVRLVPREEMIWSKAYIMERERFDGADIVHVIHAQADRIDWDHLVDRFGEHWRVLLAHLALFGFVYPTERTRIPRRIMLDLLDRLARELGSEFDGDHITQGTLLSSGQYMVDTRERGFKDARLLPPAELTREDIQVVEAARDADEARKAS